MATQIQEPGEIDGSSITPETQDRYKILVYEQAQDGAGLKQLKISDWKSYLGFNSNKVDNLASFIGPDDDYEWDSENPNPYPSDRTKLSERIQNVADQAGVSVDAVSPYTPLATRIGTLEGYVANGWEDSGTPVDGLLTRVSTNESDISTINGKIGSNAEANSILGRLYTDENAIAAIQNAIGDDSTGGTIDGRITAMETEIGDDSTSGTIKGRITANEGNITTNTTDIATINGQIGDGTTSGILYDINTINDEIGTDFVSGKTITGRITQNETDIAALKQTVSGAYTVQGDVISATNAGIIVTGGTSLMWDDLQNGWVYNVNPEGGADSLTIKGKSYNKGANIVWVDAADDFDELGSTIDVQEINDIKDDVQALDTRVQGLEGKFVTADTQWTSTGLTGFYLMNVTYSDALTGQKSASCLFNFVSGQKAMFVDLTQNYTDFFNDVAGGKVELNSLLPDGTNVYQIKLS